MTQLCPKGLLDNVYREVHIAVSGTTEVIADSNEPPGLLWRDGNLGNSSDLEFLQVEPVSDVFGAERRPPEEDAVEKRRGANRLKAVEG